jgi:probable FeS assembly SUF system protein SufT
MRNTEPIELARDVEGILIPNGTPITLPQGTEVRVTQSLGDTYTVTTDHGYMVRVSGKDADALGLEATKAPAAEASAPASPDDIEKAVWDQLRTCYDPEIPVNIVDLGLVYHCELKPLEEGGHRAEVKMTLTAPGCGMGGVIAADAQSKIASLPGIKECDVEVVFEPPWDPSMMTEAARLELGMM